MAVLGLCCCVGFPLVLASTVYALVVDLGLLMAVASLVAKHRLWSAQASVVAPGYPMAFISFICIILRYLCSLQEFLPKSLHFNCPHWIVAGISIDYFHTLQPELFPRILHLVHDTARRLVPKEY